MRLTHEQPESAHRALSGARIRHGDTSEVELAVGAVPSEGGSHLAFCSAWVRAGKVLRRGRWWQRRQLIQGDIVFANANAVAERIGGQRGIAYMRGKVVTNGHVEFSIDLDSIRVIPVAPQEECHLRRSSGQVLAQNVLADVS